MRKGIAFCRSTITQYQCEGDVASSTIEVVNVVSIILARESDGACSMRIVTTFHFVPWRAGFPYETSLASTWELSLPLAKICACKDDLFGFYLYPG